jgi:uncharacterized membrane protein YkgB
MPAALLTPPADLRIARWVQRHATTLLRFSLAAIFVWFGVLKPLGLSPAASLVERTVFWFDPAWFVPLLGAWETAIGIGLCFRRTLPWALALLFLQMPGTFLPLVLLPDVCFTEFPYGLTLEGQYIIKNLCLISAAIVVTASARLQHAQAGSAAGPASSSAEDGRPRPPLRRRLTRRMARYAPGC